MRKLILALVLTPGLIAVACTQVGNRSKQGEAAHFVAEIQHDEVAGRADKPAHPRNTGRVEAEKSGEALKFAVVSDLNGSYGSMTYHEEVHEAVRWLAEDVRPDLVISTGDMVAGQREGLDYEAMWRGFHAAVTTPLARAGIPLAITPGNHDASAGAVYQNERIIFVEQWQKHRPKVHFVDASFYPLHYAFEVGPALFISLDATVTGPIDDSQRHWLRRVLAAHKDKKVKVVFGHVPLYPFSEERKDEILADRKLEALLDEFGVDLMITGHHHAYYPGRREGLRLVGMACLGSGARTLMGTDRTSSKSVAVVDVDEDGEVSVEAYDAIDHAKIERRTLPDHLNDGEWRIWRDDVDKTN